MRCCAALCLAAALAQSLPGQGGYDVHRLAGAVFIEHIESDITSQSGTAAQQRNVVRTSTFSFSVHTDTLVMTADSIALGETANGATRTIDVDAIVGGIWKILMQPDGSAVVTDAPFVPRSVADVSDFATAADDFFPLVPPAIAAGKDRTDAAGRTWKRLADSAGIERYHLSGTKRSNSTRSLADSVAVRSSETATENSDVDWSSVLGPVRWKRHIVTVVSAEFSGRTVRATADQQISVIRLK